MSNNSSQSIKIFTYLVDRTNTTIIGHSFTTPFVTLRASDNGKSYNNPNKWVAFYLRDFPLDIIFEVVLYGK
jgi:hypothetical protein